MKTFITLISIITLIGCKSSSDEFDNEPEYIDYNVSENELVAFYNAQFKHTLIYTEYNYK